MLHIVFLLLLLAPSFALALGAESVHFYGLRADSSLVKLDFVGDPESWSENSFLYGSRTSPSFRYCWGAKKDEIRVSFKCTSAKGTAPSLSYRALGLGDADLSFQSRRTELATYRTIANRAGLGTGAHRGDGTLIKVYECAQGCTASAPRLLFEVGIFD